MAILDQSTREAQQTQSAALGRTTPIRTILTHVRPEAQDLPRLRTAAELAGKLDATLYGLGCELAALWAASDPGGVMQASWYAELSALVQSNLEQARLVFERETAGLDTCWASVEDLPVDALARISRGADLIVAGGQPLDQRDQYRNADPALLMLRAGRPVLVAPPSGGALAGAAVVVAWKDTREARRALADAMPFLCAADRVVVLECCDKGDAYDAEVRTAAVVQGLQRHGVEASPQVAVTPSESVAAELHKTADAIGADLIVAGGYGHSRLGEWMFGGVTRDLLGAPQRFVLLSH